MYRLRGERVVENKLSGGLTSLLAGLIFALSLSGCGQSGKLVLPEKEVPDAAAGSSTDQDENARATKRQNDAKQ
jgi:predicted small lipoprotein YifL